jgi:putative MATE family efflux protein
MGVTGAALATLVPRGLGFVIGVVLLSRRKLIRFAMPRLDVMKRVARVGAPPAMTGVAFSAIYVLLTRTTTKFGTPALAALGLGFRVESIVYVASVGFGVAVAAIVGQSMGAGDHKRAEGAGWSAVGLVTILGVTMSVIIMLFAEEVAALFSTDNAVILEAARYMRIAAFSQIFLGAEIVLESAMGGAGYTFVPMLFSMSITASRIPLAIWSTARWGTTGLWWTLAGTAAARGIVMGLLWYRGRWKTVVV